jgi:hypothetical protein
MQVSKKSFLQKTAVQEQPYASCAYFTSQASLTVSGSFMRSAIFKYRSAKVER